jgi:hypothetical protein
MAERPLSPAESRAAALSAARVAALGVALFAATRVVGAILDSMSMASIVAQTVVAELGAGRLGVAWSDPLAPMPKTAAIVKRALAGAAVGAAVAVVLTVFLAASSAARLSRVEPSSSAAAIALVTAGLLAMRDELLLHGLVMRAMVSVEAAVPRVLACGLTSAAAAFGDGAAPRAVLAQGLLGLVFGALWTRDRGAWQAWGAHTAWFFGTSMLLDAGVYDARVASNAWGGADAGWIGGMAAVVALLPFGAAALISAAQRERHERRSPRTGPVG